MSEDAQLATVEREPSVALMLQGMLASIQQGQITPQSVDVLKGMMDLYERNEDRQAKKEFAAALASCQAETGMISAMAVVKNKDGTERYRYAKFEHVMQRAQPIMAAHGFSHSFDTVEADGRLTAIFKLTHKSGHSECNKFSVRVGKGQGTNDMQDDMGAKSYAKRGALCDGLGIVISHDDDARAQGAPITAEQAAELQARVTACGANQEAFLKFAGAATFEAIGSARWEALDQMLSRKERAKKSEPERKEELDADGNIKW